MIEFVPMAATDIADALTLWSMCDGIALRPGDDSPAALAHFLARNPNCSHVARKGNTLVGAALAGHDGRRGHLYHVAVAPRQRRMGIGRRLVEHCLTALANLDIAKCHILVCIDNEEGMKFWNQMGWGSRDDLQLLFTTPPSDRNA